MIGDGEALAPLDVAQAALEASVRERLDPPTIVLIATAAFLVAASVESLSALR